MILLRCQAHIVWGEPVPRQKAGVSFVAVGVCENLQRITSLQTVSMCVVLLYKVLNVVRDRRVRHGT